MKITERQARIKVLEQSISDANKALAQERINLNYDIEALKKLSNKVLKSDNTFYFIGNYNSAIDKFDVSEIIFTQDSKRLQRTVQKSSEEVEELVKVLTTVSLTTGIQALVSC